MSKTVTMRKGDKYADIFNSPETIAQAQKDGYHVCNDKEIDAREALVKTAPTDIQAALDIKTRASDLFIFKKDELLVFAANKKIDDGTFNTLKKDELLVKIIETIRARIVEANLKTADDVASLSETDLLTLFETIAPPLI